MNSVATALLLFLFLTIHCFEYYDYNQNNGVRLFAEALRKPNSHPLPLPHFCSIYNVSLLTTQFNQDFLIWRQAGGITREMQQKAMLHPTVEHYTFSIINQTLYYFNTKPLYADWLIELKRIFSKLLNVIKINNVQFTLNKQDNCLVSYEDPIPILCIGKPKHSPCISIPVHSTFIASESLQFFKNHGEFDKKKNQVVFRGWMTNGYDHTEYNWIHKSRPKLMLTAQHKNHLFDVGFTMRHPGGITVSKKVIEAVNQTIGWKSSISFPTQLQQYKYLINLEGHGPAWRFISMLGSNNAVLLVEPTLLEHYYADLEPMVHYIPVKKTMEDLIEKVEWANANPSKVKDIALQGSDFARKHLRVMDLYAYLAAVLNELSSLQRFDHDLSDAKWEMVYSPFINKTIP